MFYTRVSSKDAWCASLIRSRDGQDDGMRHALRTYGNADRWTASQTPEETRVRSWQNIFLQSVVMRHADTNFSSRSSQKTERPVLHCKRVKRQPQALQHDPNNERFEHAAPHRQATRHSESIETPTRNHASSSKSGRVMKRRKGFGWTRRRRQSKYWPARAILGENKTQYLIRYEPVNESAQCEELWQPKRNASLALIAA